MILQFNNYYKEVERKLFVRSHINQVGRKLKNFKFIK